MLNVDQIQTFLSSTLTNRCMNMIEGRGLLIIRLLTLVQEKQS